MANLYEILGVSEEATQEDIKFSYRKLSRRYHPDMTGDSEGHFFKMLAEAHETLSDPDKRAAYDASLHNEAPPVWEKTSEEYETPSMASVSREQVGIPAATPIDWDGVKWKHQEYSSKEKVVLPKPFQAKSLAFATLGVLILIPSFIFSIQLPFFKGFPIGLIAGLLIIIFGFRLGQLRLDEKWFGVSAGIAIIAHAVYSVMLGGENTGNGLISAALMTLSAASIIYAYLCYVKWVRISQGRGLLSMSAKQLKNSKRWVSTGRTIHPGGEADQRTNMVAEKRTERFAQELLTIPGTRMFSGVLHPTSSWERVQHVLINGNKVYLVDSLMLPGGKYYWLDNDTISAVKPAGYEYDVAVGTPTAIREFRHQFREAEVKAGIVLYSLDGQEIELLDSISSDDVELLTQQDFIETAGDWFSEGKTGVINRGLVSGIANYL
ncbi:MAG: DnaJ domain-containing protein [Enterococcus sp.]|nr:DnaJ domain-containing protein [Enterococcus sp.]